MKARVQRNRNSRSPRIIDADGQHAPEDIATVLALTACHVTLNGPQRPLQRDDLRTRLQSHEVAAVHGGAFGELLLREPASLAGAGDGRERLGLDR